MSPRTTRRRPAVQITDARAARLHRMARLLDERPRGRIELLDALGIGLRTFYRELDLLRRCGIKVRLNRKEYRMIGTLADAEGQLPFPDPRLSFAEMAELSSGDGPAARRLAGLLRRVLDDSAGKKPPKPRSAGAPKATEAAKAPRRKRPAK